MLVLAASHPGGFDGYFASHNPGGGAGESGGGLIGFLHQVTLGLVTPQEKVTTLILILAPTLFLALRSPLLLIALPTVMWRLASDHPAHWGTGYHYALPFMPIVFARFRGYRTVAERDGFVLLSRTEQQDATRPRPGQLPGAAEQAPPPQRQSRGAAAAPRRRVSGGSASRPRRAPRPSPPSRGPRPRPCTPGPAGP
ncbi:DUF2079 domain-containing protein [Streptomyces sp. NPDC090036]|uniref:DUF2079 domain-containing protein n=1 Tax=Streptomyces sp. NPDC090036 TaxID=3365926 RepID=UPI003824F571